MTVEYSETAAQKAEREWKLARAKALSDPLRHDIYMILSVREACPKELADELGKKLHTVMYHFRWLAGKERKRNTVPLIEMVGTDRRLGGIQHLWKAMGLNWVNIEAADSQPQQVREEGSDLVLRRVRDDISGAVEAGTMDAHPQRALLRQHFEFDDEGMRAAAKLAEAHLDALGKIAGESANRIAAGSSGFAVATETMAFPIPGVYWNGI